MDLQNDSTRPSAPSGRFEDSSSSGRKICGRAARAGQVDVEASDTVLRALYCLDVPIGTGDPQPVRLPLVWWRACIDHAQELLLNSIGGDEQHRG